MKFRTNIKKSVSVMLSVLLLISVFTVMPFTAGAATTNIKSTSAISGDFEYEILDDGTAEITEYLGNATKLEIPNTIDGYTVTSIGYGAFEYCHYFNSITIPNSVTNIITAAFINYCEILRSIEVSEENTTYSSINGNLYNKEQTELLLYPMGKTDTSFTIPDGVASIYEAAFAKCKNLRNITIPNSVTSIGDNAFWNCSSLEKIIIPDSVTSIGYGAFNDCYRLTSVTISDNLNKIDGYTFYECANLTSVTIPDSVTSIGAGAFRDCPSLKGITIGNSVKNISDFAFLDCKNLANISIPDSVTSIGGYVFEGTAWYDNQSEGVVYAGKVAYNYKGNCPETVVLKEDTVGIAKSAFDYCKNLENITIPDSVISVCEYAFDNTAWYDNQPDGVVYAGKVAYKYKGDCPKTIVLKKGTTAITKSAFENCTNLTKITIPNSITSIGDYALGYYWDYDIVKHRKVDNFTINGYKGTEAEKYAKDNGFTFVELKYPTSSEITPTTAKTTVTLKNAPKTIYVKGTAQINALVENSKGATTYKSSDKKVAKVSTKGKITALKKGTATITVTNNGVSKSFKITVKNPKLNKMKRTLKKGDTFKLTITGKVGKQTYASNNKKVATVNKNGKITAKKKGNATITVKTNGMKLKCTIKVK